MNTGSRFNTEKLEQTILSSSYCIPLYRCRNIIITAIIFTLLTFPACSLTSAPPKTNPSSSPPANRNLIVDIKGIAFHDYNGNGTKEYNEPVLPGLNLEFFDQEINQRFKIQTDNYGAYNHSLPAISYQLIVSKNILGYNNQPFNYLYISPNEVKNIDEPIYISINKDMTYNLALMQGFLTLPFSIVTGSYIDTVFFDIDRRENFIRDWQGNQQTYDQHSGIDYRIPIDTPVIASAPGQVLSSKYDQQSGNIIAIVHGLFVTQYGHLNKRTVRTGDKVTRGQQIGSSGATGEWVGKFPHLHFDLSEVILPRIDIYRDITNPESFSYWTVDNNPQYP